MKKIGFIVIFVIAFFFIITPLDSNKYINENKNKKTVKDNQTITEDQYGDDYNNEDIVGKIKIEGTNILSYILQTTDNDYYLNHNIKKEEDITGAIFMDYRNSIDDRKILIFGHNARKIKAPFQDLEKYKDKKFYDLHKYIELTFDTKVSKWLIFSYMYTSKDNNDHMKLKYNEDEWLNYLYYIKNNSIYDTEVDVKGDDKIIVLQTCSYDVDNSFILISAKKIE